MTTALDQEAEVRRLFFAEHWRVGTIVAQLGLHREVVLRITGLDSPRRVRPLAAPTEETAVTPFVDFIAETLQRYPRLRSGSERSMRQMRLQILCCQRSLQSSERLVQKLERQQRSLH